MPLLAHSQQFPLHVLIKRHLWVTMLQVLVLTMGNLKIGIFNVKGLRNDLKRCKVFQYLHQRQFDIICLQESHSIQRDQKRWKAEWGGEVIFSHGTSESRGVTILIKKKCPVNLGKIDRDEEGRILVCELTHEGLHFILTNMYAHNKDEPQFFIEVFQRIAKMEQETLSDSKMIVGDLNLVLDLAKDKFGGRNTTHTKCQTLLKSYMEDEELEDIYRIQHPDSKETTWRSLSPNPIL